MPTLLRGFLVLLVLVGTTAGTGLADDDGQATDRRALLAKGLDLVRTRVQVNVSLPGERYHLYVWRKGPGGIPNEVLDPRVRPLGLSAAERDDLVSFLEALTGSDVNQLVSDAFAAPIGDVR